MPASLKSETTLQISINTGMSQKEKADVCSESHILVLDFAGLTLMAPPNWTDDIHSNSDML